MLSGISGQTGQSLKLPNHTLLYGVILSALGALVALGAATRVVEFVEFFPLRLPQNANELISSYIPFILGTFITAVASIAGIMVGIGWFFNGIREIARLSVPMKRPGEFFEPERVSVGLKEGRVMTYDRAPTFLFSVIGRFWTNATYVSAIPGEMVRNSLSFIWRAIFIGICVYIVFSGLEALPLRLHEWGFSGDIHIPSPTPFYHFLIFVCIVKMIIAISLIPLKRPGAGREMDSMIVEGKGHPSVFFSILEEGSRVFSHKGFSNRVSRSRPVVCEDGETLLGTIVESFPEYIKARVKPAALICLLLGAVMTLTGFLQIILMRYPSFSVGYQDFFNLYFAGIALDIVLNVLVIVVGKGFLDQARSLMSLYRFRSRIVYVEAKGDFDRKVLPDLNGIVAPERLYDPLSTSAFNVRFFSAEAISEAIDPQGVRELVGLETSARLAKDVSRLKHLPFHVDFRERYPSAYASAVSDDEFYGIEAEAEESPDGMISHDNDIEPLTAGSQR